MASFGVLIAMPQHEALFAFAVLVIIAALMIEKDSWGMVFAALATLAFLVITGQSSWELILMLCILVLFTVKQFNELRTVPGLRGRLVRWLSR